VAATLDLHQLQAVFGQIKEQQGARRFLRRGMRACQAEWKLLCGTTTCSSCGGTRSRHERPGRRSPERSPGESVEAAATAVDQPLQPSPEAAERSATISDLSAPSLSNSW
jgi:hypothetical protein